MNLHNINTIARYEVKLLRRGWLFRIFAIIALLGVSGGLLYWQTGLFNAFENHWTKIALTSLMPFMSIYLYNLAQSIIVIFLAGNFLKRDKKLDTAEVIYVRPMSNADYIIGKTWGIVQVFILLNAITLAITAIFNIAINHSPFDPFPYVFYLFAISLPSLLFVLGLSFTMMCLCKNQAITFVVMLGLIGTVFFKLSTSLYGVFDFFGINIPAIFSDVTGHVDLKSFLLQRTIYLIAGIGLICFTIALVKRLPHKPWKVYITHTLGGVCLLVACICAFSYVLHYENQMDTRQKYIAVFNKYATEPQAHIIDHQLTITPQGDHMEGKSVLRLSNQDQAELKQIILYLNPTLELQTVEANQQPVSYERDEQVIVINKPLKRFEELSLVLNYAGKIDELICYTDISDTTYLDNTIEKVPFQFGKRYAWLDEQFTLLTPECIWYPVAVPPVNPAFPYQIQKDFTQYHLTVNYSGDKTVLSQGTSKQENGKVVFHTPQPLHGISLTIADYEKKSLQVDDLEYALYHFKGHDYFLQHFTHFQDSLPGIIRSLKDEIEVAKNRDYPFQKFVLAETPAQFASYIRNWKGYTEFVMPEIVFIPERGVSLNSDFGADKTRMKRWNRPGQVAMDDVETETFIFRTFVQTIFVQEDVRLDWFSQNKTVNPFNIAPQFFNHTHFMYSREYPMMDVILNTMQNIPTTTNFRMWGSIINDEQRANLYLEDHSFQAALSDINIKPSIFYELLKLKSKAFKNYVHTQMPPEYFTEFVDNFFKRHQFSNISFDLFTRELEYEYGVDIKPFLKSWYLEDHSPTLYIKDVDANQVVIDEITKYQVKFKVNNPSDVNAIITVNIMQGGGFQRGGWGGGGGGIYTEMTPENYIVPAQQAREIKIIVDERPANVQINTNISHNLPSPYTTHFAKIETMAPDDLSGSFPIDPQIFESDAREIIVDNEDRNFKVIESNNRHKLKDLFQQEEKEKYQNINFWRIPSKWTAIATDYCYGATICSALYKKPGSGKNAVQWSADIPKGGYYEISVWNPKQNRPMMRGRGREREVRNQTYTISYNGEEEALTIDLEQVESGWVSFGNFFLPEGEVTVTLTDKVSGRFVIADAIKFTRVEK